MNVESKYLELKLQKKKIPWINKPLHCLYNEISNLLSRVLFCILSMTGSCPLMTLLADMAQAWIIF